MAIPFIAERKEVKLRGYFMRHKTGGDVGFSWKKDDPKFSDEWERIAAVPEVVSAPTAGELDHDAEMFAMLEADMAQDGAIHEMDGAAIWAAFQGWLCARSAGDSVPETRNIFEHKRIGEFTVQVTFRSARACGKFIESIGAAPAPGNTEKPKR